MGLFDKKFCDICGEKIGLLGNKKLEDGNLCKHCARKLSPFFSERRSSTVDEIKQQLAYREENRGKLASFYPTKNYGMSDKVYVDMNSRKFIVTSDNNWREENPDIIDFSQVLGVNTEIEENKEELFYEDNEGNEKSYNPPRFKYEYKFNVTINVDSPWFSQIEFELSRYDNRPDSRYSAEYRELEMMSQELNSVLTGTQMPVSYAQPQNCAQGFTNQQNPYPPRGLYSNEEIQNIAVQHAQQSQIYSGVWICGGCGVQSTGKFCNNCGTPRSAQQSGTVRCDKCGWQSQPNMQIPKFCPQCGDPIDFRDM